MPKLSLAVPHSLSQEEAATKLKNLMERVRAKYQDQVSDLEEEWGDTTGRFSFKSYGFAVKGTIAVEPSEIKVDGEIPFAAMMFKGKIEQTIRENLERLVRS